MEALLESATIIPIAVVVARLVVPLFIPAYPLPAILVAMVLDAVDQTIFSITLGLRPRRLPDLRQGARHLLPRHRLYLDDRQLGRRPGLRRGPIPVVLPPRRRRAVREHRRAVAALRLPQHVRVLLRRHRGLPDRAQPDSTQPEVRRRRRRGRHLDLHQAPAGVVDPHRAARLHRLHEGDRLRRRRRQLLDRCDRASPMVAVAWSWRRGC